MRYKKKLTHILTTNKQSKINIYYLLGKKSDQIIFYPILIPRNDTEIISELIQYIYNKKNIIIDLCSGSGIILSYRNQSFNTKILIDYNYMSILLNLTHKNFSLYCELNYSIKSNKKINLLLSNPPYICLKHLNFYSLIKKNKSLYATFNGLDYFLFIINSTYNILEKNAILIIEHSFNQSKLIRKIMLNKGFSNIKTLNDLNKLSRLTYCEK